MAPLPVSALVLALSAAPSAAESLRAGSMVETVVLPVLPEPTPMGEMPEKDADGCVVKDEQTWCEKDGRWIRKSDGCHWCSKRKSGRPLP